MPRSASDAYRDLLAAFRPIYDLGQVANLLVWDQQTMMPPGGAPLRGQQLATLSSEIHRRLTGPGIAEPLQVLASATAAAELTDVQRAQVREARRAYAQEAKMPAELVEEISEQNSRAQGVWVEARKVNDFGRFAPELERTLDLRRRQADHLGWEDHPYDALHDLYEPGSTTAKVREVFGPVKEGIERLLGAIGERGRNVADDVLHLAYDESLQEQFAREVIADLGYDFTRGRLDRAAHPFAQGLGHSDVRITTRYRPSYLSTALFGSMHEAGHAIYEQGISPDWHRTPLADAVSLGVHESQSRLWENLVGRSHAFWEGRLARLAELFPTQLGSVSVDAFARAVNNVAPTLIRVEADEVTYNLHVMIRFELEVALLEGSLAVLDLPEAWRAKYAESLGVTPPDDADGCLQDIHWAAGLIGYFPTYTLGNLMSVQLWEAAERDLGDLTDRVREGRFEPLLGWLREHVHVHGSRYLPGELLERATGSRLDSGPYLRYLERKYGALYGLDDVELSPVSEQG
jgi:carboxypeptidase Taq